MVMDIETYLKIVVEKIKHFFVIFKFIETKTRQIVSDGESK